jgi:hypothetical protein
MAAGEERRKLLCAASRWGFSLSEGSSCTAGSPRRPRQCRMRSPISRRPSRSWSNGDARHADQVEDHGDERARLKDWTLTETGAGRYERSRLIVAGARGPRSSST